MNVTLNVSHNSWSHGAPAFSQSFIASKRSVIKAGLPIPQRAFTASLANFGIAVNVKAEDGKTIMVNLFAEDQASTDYCYIYSKFAIKTNLYTYYPVTSPSTTVGLGEEEQSFVAL